MLVLVTQFSLIIETIGICPRFLAAFIWTIIVMLRKCLRDPIPEIYDAARYQIKGDGGIIN